MIIKAKHLPLNYFLEEKTDVNDLSGLVPSTRANIKWTVYDAGSKVSRNSGANTWDSWEVYSDIGWKPLCIWGEDVCSENSLGSPSSDEKYKYSVQTTTLYFHK